MRAARARRNKHPDGRQRSKQTPCLAGRGRSASSALCSLAGWLSAERCVGLQSSEEAALLLLSHIVPAKLRSLSACPSASPLGVQPCLQPLPQRRAAFPAARLFLVCSNSMNLCGDPSLPASAACRLAPAVRSNGFYSEPCTPVTQNTNLTTSPGCFQSATSVGPCRSSTPPAQLCAPGSSGWKRLSGVLPGVLLPGQWCWVGGHAGAWIFGFIPFQWVCLATEDAKPCLEGLGYAEEGSVDPFL